MKKWLFLLVGAFAFLLVFGLIFYSMMKNSGVPDFKITELILPSESAVKAPLLLGDATLLIENKELLIYEVTFAFDTKVINKVSKDTFLYKNGGYKGEHNNGKRQGKGVFVTKDGVKVSCLWKDGKPYGGVLINFPNKDIYKGKLLNGKLSGKGEYLFSDGVYYTGDFSDGNISGNGKVLYKTGDCYEGCFVNGLRQDANGKYIFQSGVTHEGNFVNNKINGYGKRTFQDGFYEGEFADGLRAGAGEFTYTKSDINGDYYQGEYKSDKPDGKGVYYDSSENLLRSGTWKNGIRISYE